MDVRIFDWLDYVKERYNEQLEEKREQLEKKKSESLGLAILFLFIFWPAAIFFFIRWISTSSELKNLK